MAWSGGGVIVLRRTNCVSNSQNLKALPLVECLAKTIVDTDGLSKPGIDVETHCKIVGMVAKELLSRFPETLRENIFPDGCELVAASHDVGKVNPLFQEKIHRLLDDYVSNSLPGLESARPEMEERTGWHSGVSQASLYGVGRYIPEIAGKHHGYSPNANSLLPQDPVIGGYAWQKERMTLIDNLKRYFNKDWPKIKDDIHAGAVAGLTTVSDWIGSGPVFDNLARIEQSKYEELVKIAVDRAGFIPPKLRKGLGFEEVFFPYTPRPIQAALYKKVDSPGIYIMEALMGEGKTEAALLAAYQMMERGLANGIYFALPTQITSEKIFERMQVFLDKILDTEDRHRSLLLHGNAWLYDTDLGEDARPGYAWFDSRKRRILAPFAVGTIDQALMAVMNVKHGFVRTFGLAGKVVILDEVHTYDAYTGTIMDNLVKALAELGCTVILLSATLTNDRKTKLSSIGTHTSGTSHPTHYPLITRALPGHQVEFSSPLTTESSKVSVSLAHEEKDVLELVRTKALRGEYVLWIENTVQEAQQVFKTFAAWGRERGIEVGLLHSRFPAVARGTLDSHWVELFGKRGIEERDKGGKILIGTQVLEQSLDIDADLLITRIAPTDMILQRIGRLWRHREIDEVRPEGTMRQVVILSIPLETAWKNPARTFGPSGKVYAPYVLARSLAVWNSINEISIPVDLRKLIEATYEERKEEKEMAKVKADLDQQRSRLERFAYNSMAMAGSVSSDNANTRYSDVPSRDVLLLLEEPDIQQGTVKLIDGELVDLLRTKMSDLQERKRIARILMGRLISVPEYLAPEPVSMQELSWLKPFLYVSESDDERIRVAILRPSGRINGLAGREANKQFLLEYSPLYGYSVKKRRENDK